MKNIELSEIFNLVKNSFTTKYVRIITTGKEFEIKVKEYINRSKKWADQIAFRDMKEIKNLSKIYIDLDLYLTPAKLHMDQLEKLKKTSLEETIMNLSNNLVILGQPGAGKTTSMKRIFQLFEEEKNKLPYNLTLIIRLRELKDLKYSFFSFIIEILGIKIEIHKDDQLTITDNFARSPAHQKSQKVNVREASFEHDQSVFIHFIIKLLEQNKILLVLDGFDEVPNEFQAGLVNEINELSKNLVETNFVLTSRSNDFSLHLSNTEVFEICPLTEDQLKDFARNWLSPISVAEDFITQIKASPYYDAMIRPLSLSHLCAIYERIGKIPDKPKTIHRKIVTLLIEEWDEQRQVKRNSKYSNFEQDRKFEFLANFAFLLTGKFGTTTFSKDQLEKIYLGIYQNFGLPEEDLKEVVREIETHTGIIVCISHEEYEFAHKSTQEYLSAEYLVRLPNIPNNMRFLMRMPNEIAITVSLSSSPSLYLTSFVFNAIYPLVNMFFTSKDKLQKVLVKKAIIAKKHHIKLEELEKFIVTFCGRLLIEKPDIPKTPLISISIILLNSILFNDRRNRVLAMRLFKIYGVKEHLVRYYKIENKSNLMSFKIQSIKTISDQKLPNCLVVDADFKKYMD